MKRATVRGLSVVVFCLLAGLAGYTLVSGSGSSPLGPPAPTLAPLSRWGLEFDHPLLPPDARQVSPAEAEARLGSCTDCPDLPIGGFALDPRVSEGWVNSAGDVAFVYTDGTWVVASPDSRTNEEYINESAEVVESDEFTFDVITVRGVDAVATDVNRNGPSVIMWIEGDYRWYVLGKGGQRLAELVVLAEGL